MATNPPSSPWADKPFDLISNPSRRPGVSATHSSVYCASGMARAHNVILRGFNAIVQQAPNVPASSEPGYKAQDVKDLLFYVRTWVKMVEHHHEAEEACMFPELETFTGKPGLMDGPKHQHELFTPGLDRLLRYATDTKPDEYRWNGPGGMKEMVDDFSEPLCAHLYEEIEVILGLGFVESEGLRRCWDNTKAYAKTQWKTSMWHDIMPCVFGTSDKTFEDGDPILPWLPPSPWLMPYLMKYWFAAGNGAFRFNPCDFWGYPRPLHFVPQYGRAKEGGQEDH